MNARSWDWSMDLIAHLDVETDGLVVQGQPLPLMLEVALVLTNADLDVLGMVRAVIKHPHDVLDALDPHPVVVSMHQESGLWEDLRHPDTVPLVEAEDAMIALLDQHPTEVPIVWSGFSPAALDRPMIEGNMGRFYRRIHHRTLDASSLKLAMRSWAGRSPKARGEAVHRALPDTIESIAVLKDYQRWLELASAERVALEVERVTTPPPIACR